MGEFLQFVLLALFKIQPFPGGQAFSALSPQTPVQCNENNFYVKLQTYFKCSDTLSTLHMCTTTSYSHIILAHLMLDFQIFYEF